MASNPKRPAGSGLRPADQKRNTLMQIGLVAAVLVFAVGLIGYIVLSNSGKKHADSGDGVRITSDKLIHEEGTDNPKVVVSFYEDFLCPACGNMERAFGPTVNKMVEVGAIAADYHMVAILDRPQYDNYSSRAGAAAYCVAEESTEAFGRFHAMLYSERLQPAEGGGDYPDNNRLIELARQAGAAGKVPACVNSGKYLKMVRGMAKATDINATPTIRINGEDYRWSTPQALVDKVKEIVGDVPGLEVVTPAASNAPAPESAPATPPAPASTVPSTKPAPAASAPPAPKK